MDLVLDLAIYIAQAVVWKLVINLELDDNEERVDQGQTRLALRS
ncbi:hypothetical protein PF008_g14706 [Phytophthora fragariae]|uniref:Uncharacterized protein n=1 Tax=Phytophthora fragariae TaxID=53985 RepID=A0A6G0RG93_9STRA|nr:hypothetical protein PF008_g14706 [Phytophthora fragariae]